MNTQNLTFSRSQTGATLIVALVILGVMTILAVSTMKSSTLQERMANNSRQKLIADNAAESALREAEQWLFSEVNSVNRISDHFFSTPTQGCYADRDLPSIAQISGDRVADSIADLSDDDLWLADTDTSRSTLDLNEDWDDGDWARTPRVVIEILGPVKAGENKKGGTAQNLDGEMSQPLTGPWVFRITAIGWSKNPDIYSVLQTTYTTGRQFGG